MLKEEFAGISEKFASNKTVLFTRIYLIAWWKHATMFLPYLGIKVSFSIFAQIRENMGKFPPGKFPPRT